MFVKKESERDTECEYVTERNVERDRLRERERACGTLRCEL